MDRCEHVSLTVVNVADIATVTKRLVVYRLLRSAMHYACRGEINRNVETLKSAMWDVSTCTATAVIVDSVKQTGVRRDNSSIWVSFEPDGWWRGPKVKEWRCPVPVLFRPRYFGAA